MKTWHIMRCGKRIIIAAVAIAFNLPLLWTLFASFGVVPDNRLHPPIWSFSFTSENYLTITTDPNLLGEVVTSAFIAITTTAITILISFLVAYSLARGYFRYKELLVQGLLVLASLPAISYVVPLRGLLLVTRLYDTFPGIVLSEVALFSPLAAYVIHGYIVQLSIEVEEAAHLEAASLFQILKDIVAPSIAPGLAATAIIIVTLSWNQLLLPMVVTGMRVRTVPVMLSDFFTYERELEWGTAAASLIISLIPLIFFIAAVHQILEHFRFNIVTDD